MANTLLFIVNPRAGRTRSTAPLFDAVAHFCASGYLVDLRLTQAREDATRLARELGGKFDAVVCCGGDGTLNETVTGLMDLPSPPPLGYIPAGSTNDFAASLHLPDQPLEAARVITASGGRPLDVGSFNGRPFIYVASFGAFTRSSYAASQAAKNALEAAGFFMRATGTSTFYTNSSRAQSQSVAGGETAAIGTVIDVQFSTVVEDGYAGLD